ncbi:hypothetical protein [Maribacter cobaltidurans]|uniref:Uncharacterized protein n=1 Tax=Maribacter cobaltidurans TaxID=1178778 RepID=A0A223V5S7_9FLAO|nr:hypothetical protein [Maribacter cobaltidurans]ASV30753.1 hypothetical protein CJ263_11285 [Maribacter cobaltidurans]GGD81488.1 hypothetical protein GCM10011412_19020 [Maribacter cobaltidurans]
MQGLINVKGYSEKYLKLAIRQWIDLYLESLYNERTFNLFQLEDSIQIRIDNISNQLFFFLINYLKYPEDIKGPIEILGYTGGDETSDFKGQDILIYIPSDDTEYDNVYVVTENNNHFKIDFGGGIKKVNSRIPEFFKLTPVSTSSINTITVYTKMSVYPDKKQFFKTIEGRFAIISLALLIFLVFHFLYINGNSDMMEKERVTWFLYAGVSIWFYIDGEILKKDILYLGCFAIAIILMVYGGNFVNNFPIIITEKLGPFTLMPLAFLMLQWPLRRIYKGLFKKEPKTDRGGGITDFIYSMALIFGSIILPFVLYGFMNR